MYRYLYDSCQDFNACIFKLPDSSNIHLGTS